MSSNQQQKQIYVHSDWSRDFAEVSQKTIGRGSFGRVFLVRSKESGKYYALKKIDLLQPILKMSILNQTYARDEGAKLIQLNVQHENILTYHRAYLHADHTINWLMEYCDGGTLKDRIRVYIRAAKQFEENLIWYWSMQILRGVEFLHANGIIHRDLKPDNVYIESKHGTCKIGDFGFAKVIGQASVNENTTISVVDDESQDGGGDSSVTVDSDRGELITTNGEAKIAYKLINVSQVGTPSYMAPECRCLVESHLNYCSIQTVEKATRLCERNIMKADIFSFGCIVYEMAVLRSAFENKFSLPASTEQIKQTRLGERLDRYSADLKAIIQLTLSFDPEERPDVQELLANPTIRVKMSDTSLADAYKSQVTPTLNLNATFAKKNVLECKQATLKECFKPISIKSLKFNQNFIVVLLNKHMNMQRASTVTVGEGIQRFTSKLHTFISTRDETPGPDGDGGESSEYIDESMFAVYNHYCKLVKEINVFRLTDSSGRAQSSESESLFGYMRFKSYDFCVDEENDHVYVSTLKHGIMRFRVSKRNFYFEDLAFDGRLDLASELPSKIFPTCMVLIENEDVFRSDLHSHCAAAAATATVATKPQSSSKRRLVFFDRNSRRLTQLQTSVAQPSVAMVTMATHDSILASRLVKCNVNAGHTLSSEITMVKQMISTRDMLICLFDDQSLVNIYNLKTLQLLRTNELSVQRVNADSVHYSLCCVAIDSENNLYSTNGKHIFNYDYDEFKVKGKRIKPVVMGGQDLSQIICLMTILNDGKLALLTDALQDETSQLYILNPVSRRRLNCGSGSEVTAATTT